MAEGLTLEELMRLSYNAGREWPEHGWTVWWEKFGRERYEDYQTEDGPSEAPAE